MSKLQTHERFKDARLIYNQHGKQTMAEVEKATGISQSLICDLEKDPSENIEQQKRPRRVGYQTVADLAAYYGVSSDWLLGLSDVRSAEPTLNAACEYTGLTENVIELIRNNSKIQLVLNQGIEYKDAFLTFLDQLYYCYHEAYNLNQPEPVRVRGDGFQYFQGSLMRSVIELRVSSSAVALADQLMSKELVSEYGYIVYQGNPMPFGPNGDRYQIEGRHGRNGHNQAD